MSGRLGMTGDSVVRGDKAFGKIAPRIVYHGTGPKAARKIMRRGFKNASGSRHGLDAVYTSTKPGDARWHSIYASDIKEGAGKRRGRVIQAMAVGPARGGYEEGHAAYDASQLIPVSVRGQKLNRIPEWGSPEADDWNKVKKAIPHMQAMEMMERFNAKGKYGAGVRALALSRRSGRVADRPKQVAYEQALMRDKLAYRHEMASALIDEGMKASPPKRSVTGMKRIRKVDTTMSEHEANHLATRYDTRGPLPKTLSREEKMKAYEARYIAAGGKKGEKWKRRADHAETGRNIGLAGATAAGAGMLLRKAPGLRRVPRHGFEHAAVASGTFGGASELYGEHARSRRASYQNSPAGVAGSALTRMQAYTPGR